MLASSSAEAADEPSILVEKDEGQLRSPQELRALLQDTFPFLDDNNVVVHAFGYGSGVLQQQQPNTNDNKEICEAKMVDVILVVRDAVLFHRANLQHNAHHYNSCMLAIKSAEHCAWLQRHALPKQPYLRNPGVYFHVVPSCNIKYGIVELSDLAADLRDWTCLYLAGRLHKPVVHIPVHDNDNNFDNNIVLGLQNEHNLPAALAAGLLLQCNSNNYANNNNTAYDSIAEAAAAAAAVAEQPRIVQQQQLYARIASLSYQGDPRVAWAAEDPHKIERLVAPQHLPRWQALYGPAANALREEGILSIEMRKDHDHDDDHQQQPPPPPPPVVCFSWDAKNPRAHARLWQSLPRHIRQKCRMDDHYLYSNNNADDVSVYRAAAHQLPVVLATAIVAPAARYQSFKGLWTAGWTKSATYAWRKLQKGWWLAGASK